MSVYGNFVSNVEASALAIDENTNFEQIVNEAFTINVLNEALDFKTVVNKIKSVIKFIKEKIKDLIKYIKKVLNDIKTKILGAKLDELNKKAKDTLTNKSANESYIFESDSENDDFYFFDVDQCERIFDAMEQCLKMIIDNDDSSPVNDDGEKDKLDYREEFSEYASTIKLPANESGYKAWKTFEAENDLLYVAVDKKKNEYITIRGILKSYIENINKIKKSTMDSTIINSAEKILNDRVSQLEKECKQLEQGAKQQDTINLKQANSMDDIATSIDGSGLDKNGMKTIQHQISITKNFMTSVQTYASSLQTFSVNFISSYNHLINLANK